MGSRSRPLDYLGVIETSNNFSTNCKRNQHRKPGRYPSLGRADLVLDGTQSLIEFVSLAIQFIERLPDPDQLTRPIRRIRRRRRFGMIGVAVSVICHWLPSSPRSHSQRRGCGGPSKTPRGEQSRVRVSLLLVRYFTHLLSGLTVRSNKQNLGCRLR